jgi:hypothetical protein
MTPDRLDKLRGVVDGLRMLGLSQEDADGLGDALSLAKSAVPSGQVAKDVDSLEGSLAVLFGQDEQFARTYADDDRATLARLAAQAQSARHAWERHAEKDRAYGDMIAQRDAAWSEVATLRKNLADAQKDAAANAEEARMLKERVHRLSAAGHVLSEHVDKAPEWTMRDEFAKAAMQALYTSPGRQNLEDDTAKRAYRMADAMVAVRSNAVDITPEQEKAWETEARKEAAEQMKTACLKEVHAYLENIGLHHAAPMWGDLAEAVARAKVAP